MKSKYLILSGIFLIFTLLTSADKLVDEYKVIKVTGKILYKNSGKVMSTGDVFNSNVPLKFSSDNSRAAVISKSKGRFVLAPPSKSQKTNLVPAVNNISSRSGGIVNELDLKNHFSGNYLILDRLELPINEKSFPQDKKHFFFLSYQYRGEKIAKKLPSDGNKLILDKNDIFSIDGKSIAPFNTEMILFYRDASSKENVMISKFNPIFPDNESLKKEVEVILNEYSEKTEEKKFNEIKGYLTEFYGKPYDDNLNEWLEQFSSSK
ncbi:MAG: hypothetical protein COA32_04280 [Fluviicola sp.]|nr:MAG: hypothetical protein COA32_04280 [Fluviicola sp.]